MVPKPSASQHSISGCHTGALTPAFLHSKSPPFPFSQSIVAAVANAAPGSRLDVQEMLRQLTGQSVPGLAAAIQQATASK